MSALAMKASRRGVPHAGHQPPSATTGLTPSEERHLFVNWRDEWIAHVAPGMAARLAECTPEAVRAIWPRMQPDYQAAVWAQFSSATCDALRDLQPRGERKRHG